MILFNLIYLKVWNSDIADQDQVTQLETAQRNIVEDEEQCAPPGGTIRRQKSF